MSNKLFAAKNMHQYYRDAFSLSISFPDTGKISRQIIAEIIESGSCDVPDISERLFKENSGLSENKDKALKLMLVLICQSNIALDKNNSGKQQVLNEAFIYSVRNSFHKIIALDPSESYLVIMIQILYRIGDIEYILELLEKHYFLVEISTTIKKIISMIYVMDEKYELALPYLADLIEDHVEAKNSLVSLMAMSCAYKLGGCPEIPIDFSTMTKNKENIVDYIDYNFQWVIDEKNSNKDIPVIFIACDEVYFFEHAVALAYSINETNGSAVAIHFHVYNSNPSIIKKIHQIKDKFIDVCITLTTEKIQHHSKIKVDFACRRFIAVSKIIEYLDAPMIIADADILFRKNWSDWIGEDGQVADIIYSAQEAAPFWENVFAALIYIKNSKNSIIYIKNVAKFILNNLNKKNYVWFLDQIALSACLDEIDKEKTKIIARPFLVDINHQDKSMSWAVTTSKSSPIEYNEYKNHLLLRNENIAIVGFNKIFSFLSNTKDIVYFVQVGAMDGVSYDPIHEYVKNFNWSGILIEPLPDMMIRLKDNYSDCKNLIFENVAISEKSEVKNLYRVEAEVIKSQNFPHWLQGMSTFVEGKLDDYNPFVVTQPVQCEPLMSILNKHNLPRIDVLQIDTEGFDYKVFKQFDFDKYRPSVINIEFVHLNTEEFNCLESDLDKHGYFFYKNGMDLIALDAELFKK